MSERDELVAEIKAKRAFRADPALDPKVADAAKDVCALGITSPRLGFAISRLRDLLAQLGRGRKSHRRPTF